jgi:hypothetical protein
MQVRVIRTIEVKPACLSEFFDLTLKGAEYVESRTGVQPEVFWVRHGSKRPTDAKVFMDFESLAEYEKLFLEGLLYDERYLRMSEQAAHMITEEPRDELLVLMDKDDFFMNLNGGSAESGAQPANRPLRPREARRYRLTRHVDVRTGKLRDFMQASFAFMDRFESVVGFRPDLFCTRFTQERIGCTNMFFDYDDCPMCEPILMRQTEELVKTAGDVVDGVPTDELFVRVGPEALATEALWG